MRVCDKSSLLQLVNDFKKKGIIPLTDNFGPVIGEVLDVWTEDDRLKCKARMKDGIIIVGDCTP